MFSLDESLAKRFAASTLGHVGREYPNGLAIQITEPTFVSPRALHPIFYGSFDWHSCVHGWWQLFRLARLFPSLSNGIYSRAEATFTADPVAGEVGYLKAHPGFERPYGWGWFLALHLEMSLQNSVDPHILDPMAELLSRRLAEYLPRLTYPIRCGFHPNTAFAAIMSYDWACKFDLKLKQTIDDWAVSRFKDDRAAPWLEPSGEDFLSPTLAEAVLMARVLPSEDFVAWFDRYLPELPENLLKPAEVSDRSDGRIGHLDGLNLSRAWCWRVLAARLPLLRDEAAKAADALLAAALPHLEANYMSEHWLCSFALLALTEN